jgi:hypothetical protein
VPDRRFHERINEVLRDDILAQLRTARRPMSTTELREKAPTQLFGPNGTRRFPPLQEQVYRALCRLRSEGKVDQHCARGRIVTWVAVAGDADDEIADLEASFQASPTADDPSDTYPRKATPR